MNEHVTVWLEAYHDGELQGSYRQQVEDHLVHCSSCRSELEELQRLVALLEENPAAENLTPSDQFLTQFYNKLEPRPEQPVWRRALESGWRLAPAGLLGAGALIQASFVTSWALMPVLRAVSGESQIGQMLLASQQESWLNTASQLADAGAGEAGQIVLQLLFNGGPLGWSVTLNLVLLFVIGLLLWSWLAGWWARQRHQRLQQNEKKSRSK